MKVASKQMQTEANESLFFNQAPEIYGDIKPVRAGGSIVSHVEHRSLMFVQTPRA